MTLDPADDEARVLTKHLRQVTDHEPYRRCGEGAVHRVVPGR
jgi:hypothetical protein